MNTVLLKIHPSDNVAVVLRPICKGEKLIVDRTVLIAVEDIPTGHKVALCDIANNQNVIKYGFPIGHSCRDIKAGQWLNEHNLKTNLSGTQEYTYMPQRIEQRFWNEGLTFMGYRRRNGEVGIRNELWIIPTVGCVNGICQRLAETMRKETGSANIIAYPHNYGCSQLGGDHQNTRKILRDMVHHPNAGAVLVVGLGCENNQPDEFERFCMGYDKERVRFVATQQIKGDELETCLAVLHELYALMQKDQREPCPLSMLRVGLKCGGSDSFSGITANPLLGVFSDWLVAQGGSVVLTEVPEMFGAESILMNRCETRELFMKTVNLINDFKDFYLRHEEPVGENPSPGNKAGGISTLEEKSLGCTQKCGTSTVRSVLDYGERLQTEGLSLLSAPGNDLVASTALAASGCQMVLFTTGRGTPFGTFVPTMKISSNSKLYHNKSAWMDFDAGTLVAGTEMETLFHKLRGLVLATVNGNLVKNETNGYKDIAIFKTGVTL
ncbi:MAG: altronate dehydratase [Bacteroidaceae bacterium]|nr:altronate dehydratase [Bacteroidaceae bacterium]